MPQTSIRLSDDLLEALDQESDERDVPRSEYIRDILRTRDRIEELERENERLRNEKRAIIQQREDHSELVEYVSDEQRYRQAGIIQRVKWWFRGME